MQIAGYFNGEFVAGEGADLRIENPSDASEVACFPGLSLEQIGATIASARQVFNNGHWSQRPLHERAKVLHRFIDAMEDRAVAIKHVLVAETGCPAHSSSMQAQFATPMRMAREIIDLMAGLPEAEENPLPPAESRNRLGQKVRSLRSYGPLGVVVGISAYNFPLHTGVWKALPALIAGNSVILRPNPLTPLSSMAFAEAAEAVGLPPGVLNVVLEAGIEGAQLLTTHPLVDMITFTGSSPIGAQVATQAARTFKRVQCIWSWAGNQRRYSCPMPPRKPRPQRQLSAQRMRGRAVCSARGSSCRRHARRKSWNRRRRPSPRSR